MGNSRKPRYAFRNIRLKKSWGQHILIDQQVLLQIVELAELSPEDVVFEIGPGLGGLTHELASQAGRVVAVEVDQRMAEHLEDAFAANPHVEVIHNDVLKWDFASYFAGSNHPIKVVANLPYQITTPLFFRLLENRRLFSPLILMMQQEVGDRMVAQPGSKAYGVLSIMAQLYFDVVQELRIGPESFKPRPRVNSVLLRFQPLQFPRISLKDEKFFSKVVKAAFGQRRKMLGNALKSLGPLFPIEKYAEVFQSTGIDPRCRGESLSIEEFGLLSDAIYAIKE